MEGGKRVEALLWGQRVVDVPHHPPRHLSWFRGGLVFKAHRWLCHSTLGSRVIKKKKKFGVWGSGFEVEGHFSVDPGGGGRGEVRGLDR